MLPLSGERVNARGIVCEKLDSFDTIRGSSTLKRGFAHMQKNGVVMDVTNVEQALIAQEAGAVSVMVLDKLPSEVRKAGGVARTASIKIIEEIMDSVTIPVMAKCRIGHVNEALVLQETDVDMIDESEVLTPADELRHIWKWDLTTPVVNFAAGGIATPADAAYLMSLGCDGIFVGSGIFSADDAQERANAIVLATTFWNEPDRVKEAQKMIDERQSIPGLDVKTLDLRMQDRGGSA